MLTWTIRLEGGPKRVNHAAVAIGSRIFSFGGYCTGEDYEKTRPMDVHMLNTDKTSKVVCQGSIHSAENIQVEPSDDEISCRTDGKSSAISFTLACSKTAWSNLDKSMCRALDTNPQQLDLDLNLRWSLLSLPTTPEDIKITPFQRYGHTAVEYENNAFVWGGRNDSVGACNTLFRFSGGTFKWDKPAVSGPIPEARDGHSACVINHKMYIFAGYEEFTDRFSNDMNYLNLKTFTWVSVAVTGKPARWRDFHTATAVGDIMYIFGGRGDICGERFTNSEYYCNKVRAFDTSSNAWLQSSQFLCNKVRTMETSHSRWLQPAPSLQGTPDGRRSHSAFEYKGLIYVFGGYNGKKECHYNDLYQLDPTTMQWTKLNVPGNCPTPRRRQCACVVGSKVYFFGGTSPRAAADKSVPAQQADSSLIDRSDLYVLDFEPSLKTLAFMVIIEQKLDNSCLPLDLRWELSTMTTDNNISRLQSTNG